MSVTLCVRSAVFQCRESFSCRGCGHGNKEGNMLCHQCAREVSKALFIPTSRVSDAAPATTCGEFTTFHHDTFERAHAPLDLSRTLAEAPVRGGWDSGFMSVEHHLSSKENMENNADAVLIRRMLRQADRVKSKSIRAYLGATAEYRFLKVQRRESTEMGVQTRVRESLR